MRDPDVLAEHAARVRRVRFALTAAALVIFVYMGIALAAYLLQRRLTYFPDTRRVAPAAAGLPDFQALTLDSDGVPIVAWWRPPPAPEAGVVIYFHGNGGNIALRAARLRDLADAGFGVLGVDYRGYGGSGGAPTEGGLREDALAAYAFVGAQAPASRIALVGESLGSGVATLLAAERPVAGIVYDSPFASAARMAAHRAPFLPTELLYRDRFDSERRIARIDAPVLIFHCREDVVIPFREGRRLFEAAREPKRFVPLSGCAHTEVWTARTRPLILDAFRTWLAPAPPLSSDRLPAAGAGPRPSR